VFGTPQREPPMMRKRRGLAALAGFALVLASAGVEAQPKRRLPEAPERGPRLDVEAIFDRQRDMIDADVAKLAPSRQGTPEIYFVGFASFAGQDVFRREVTAVRELMDDRFATKGRSLLLLNHRETTTELPLASATNLARALARVGRIMDVEKDTLVLFITTHGVPARLAVEFSRFGLNDISPGTLKTALDRSGIRNRILVISACYSGSFIETLKTPHTLILAAARTDRPSFGCSNERSWTFFGDALFNRALRETRSFTDAFERAKTTVTGWERERKFDPSEPQIFVGDQIRPLLDAIAAR
jgi:Peptidase C13 family